MPHNLFNTLQSFDLGNGKTGQYYSLPQLEKEGVGPISRLPVSIRVVLESVLRNYDGHRITEKMCAAWLTGPPKPTGPKKFLL
jgi:aconitate hydratase